MSRKSHKRVKQKLKPTDTTVARRRSSRTRKPLKYTQDYCCSSEDIATEQTKIKRKVSKQQTARSAQENNFIESPVNALSDALYSDASLELLSGVMNSQNIPPKTTQVNT